MSNEMDLANIEAYRHRAAQAVQEICHKYGLYGNVVYYAPSPIANSDRNRLYIVAGMDPAIESEKLPKEFRPDEIIRNNERNHKLFHPYAWAFDLFENQNDMQAQQDLVDYCKVANFLMHLYGSYNAQIPEKLRNSEINQLIEYCSVLEDPTSDPALVTSCEEAVNWFFKRETSKSQFRQDWLRYYRSEHFPDEKGAIARLSGFFRRNDNKMRVKDLMEVNDSLRKLEMQEHEFKIFDKLMKENHPDVIYAVGDKSVVDHGLINASGSNSPFGRAVTGEEFDVIRKEKFAKEGFAALADLRPSYFEFRDVYYKAADEPLVAGIYNRISLCYAKPNALMEMRERGDLRLTKIPASDFMNFVSLAKANNVRFYIDHDGDFANPSLDEINVIYNGCQENKILGIKNRMVDDKIQFSHLTAQHPALSSKIRSIEKTTHKRTELKTPPKYSR